MDVTSGFRALPFGPSLPNGGPDQPTNTQVHEPGHGSALTGQHQEAAGYVTYTLTTRRSDQRSLLQVVNVLVCFVLFFPGTRKSFDHLISDSKAPKRPEMESGMTTPPKMRRVAENDYEIGESAILAFPPALDAMQFV